MMDSNSDTRCQDIRCRAGQLLNRQRLAARALRRQVAAAYQTVGPRRGAIHELFAQLAEAVEGYAETLAQRSAVLGTAKAIPRAAGAEPVFEPSFVEPDALGSGDLEAQCAAVTAALAAFGQAAGAASREATAFGDTQTAEVLSAVSRGVDYHLWLVESHLGWSRALQRRGARRDPLSRGLTWCDWASLAPARTAA
jgi:starvation-inducible DNA-binding protein